MADLFSDYSFGRAWDEMFASAGEVRPAYDAVVNAVQSLDADDLKSRAENLARAFLDRGVTFDVGGVESPFPLDVIPRIIEAREWATVSRGVAQRVKALEAFLADVYGPRRCVADGVVPQRVLITSKYFERHAAGIEPANGVRVHVAGIDLIRDELGKFRVLEDNVRVPSGVSYVLENRRATMQALPELFAGVRARTVSDYPARLLQALRKAAPPGVTDPTVVLMTPGAYNAAYFEHALLARTMGVELVEGRDLVCRNNVVSMRTTLGLRRVDVIYRRIDDAFLDPVHFRPDSALGCPGVLTAARAGNVTIANAVGNGVADDKLLYTYVPDLVRYFLNEEPVIDNVDTFRLEQPDHLAEVIDRLDELVLKPVDGSGGKGIVIGPQASREELDILRTKVIDDPRGWIAQQVVHLSTVPTVIGDNIAPRHVDLRPFAVNDGDDVWVLPGGLTRVALPEGSLVVNSSQGGGSKDTLVLASPRRNTADNKEEADHMADFDIALEPPSARQAHLISPVPRSGHGATATAATTGPLMLSRIAESLFWIGRYIERADDTARILDIYLHQILEDASVEAEACRAMFEVMGRPVPDRGPGVSEVLQQLAYDQKAASSISGSLAAARVNARSARDAVSSELWEALNLTYLRMDEQARRARRTGPHLYFQWVRERAALVAGITDSTMSRDEGWMFLVLGRSIERVDMMARLMITTQAMSRSVPSWPTLLRSCGAYEAYLRTYRGRVSERTAAEFLLLDRLFPRSMFAALSTAESSLRLLDTGEGRLGSTDAAIRLLGRARTGLEYRGVDDMLADLTDQLEAIQEACAEATEALGDRYFPHTVLSWVGEEGA